jgi:GR25 family glycosyltransferase involved in LPS biosynthesis
MQNIDKVYYINLDKRLDRKKLFMTEMDNMNILPDKFKRIPGVLHRSKKGFIGCGIAHINALNDAILNEYENVIIFEDDFHFIVSQEEFEQSVHLLFKLHPDYNICLLSYNLRKKKELDSNFYDVYNAYTTSGYIISKKYFEILKSCFELAVNKLLLYNNPRLNAIDVQWNQLQGANKKFLAFKKKIGIQRDSYSDIEKRITNYNC